MERLGLSAEAPMSTAYSWHHIGTILRSLKVYIHIFSWNDLEQQTSAQGETSWRPEETQCVWKEHQTQGRVLKTPGKMNKARSKQSLQMGNCCLLPRPLHSYGILYWVWSSGLHPENLRKWRAVVLKCHSRGFFLTPSWERHEGHN